MKKLAILFTCISLVAALGCKKDADDPDPGTGGGGGGAGDPDDVSTLPWRVAPTFLPTGLWGGGDNNNTITFADSGWVNSYVKIDYTVGANGWTGYSFLNNNDWGALVPVAEGVTKVSAKVRATSSMQVDLQLFGGDVAQLDTTFVGDGAWHDMEFVLPVASQLDTATTPFGIGFNANGNPASTVLTFEMMNMVCE